MMLMKLPISFLSIVILRCIFLLPRFLHSTHSLWLPRAFSLSIHQDSFFFSYL